ncbi:MAG: nucleoside deaminase [Tidjanibacter sp.]|jgi:tRNA(adenine34) deaminase|nr:nucleoside deaminase [Tidjanibacter sp.]
METDYNIDNFFMQRALAEAREAAAEGEIPIGAVVVCGGRIVAKGHNRTEALGDATAHAEMEALTAAMNALGSKYLPEATLYVTVEPCVMCAGAIAWSQLGRLVYGASEPKRGFTTIAGRILHPKTQVVSGVMAEECGVLMEEFFRGLRR